MFYMYVKSQQFSSTYRFGIKQILCNNYISKQHIFDNLFYKLLTFTIAYEFFIFIIMIFMYFCMTIWKQKVHIFLMFPLLIITNIIITLHFKQIYLIRYSWLIDHLPVSDLNLKLYAFEFSLSYFPYGGQNATRSMKEQ